MTDKFVLVNLKQYRNASLDGAKNLLDRLGEVRAPRGIHPGFAVPVYDLAVLKDRFPRMEIISQHVDGTPFGPFTGQVSIEALKKMGIGASLLNHSERRIPEKEIEKVLQMAMKQEFKVFLCVERVEEARRFSKMGAEFISYEPPELIGGDISVATAKPEVIEEVISACSETNTKVLVGAGIKKPEDVQKSMELGAVGILVASGVVLASDPPAVLEGFIKAISR
ncbi:MAG: triose-phosphate isomerase [Candidatus Thermoplasmatota archaeon]|jgi:triosephosphate isomerase|nr:triose-phosphate isomerase [Candidatus Thermoplasmatota archaeon]MCL5786194.1 triose-phosphate isomerase [Candidatus Thermoplasmatota archaeon]